MTSKISEYSVHVSIETVETVVYALIAYEALLGNLIWSQGDFFRFHGRKNEKIARSELMIRYE